MVNCEFCGKEVKKGTGVKYVLDNGKTYDFCSSKCRNNTLKLKRDPRKFKWTKFFVKNKDF